ncbi:unnamed protein product [Peronospora farinosa]|uniref:Uncharacterized protein n=1 Tax=Peronospora farinosa TaxID=134698 RepID=A0AAV0STC9_9STRA|nr:unnamed protein product [Peronospora farinosa]
MYFSVVERIAAGEMPTWALKPGQVVYITTGSRISDETDVVVKIEDTWSGQQRVGERTGGEHLEGCKGRPGYSSRWIGHLLGELPVMRTKLFLLLRLDILATAGSDGTLKACNGHSLTR